MRQRRNRLMLPRQALGLMPLALLAILPARAAEPDMAFGAYQTGHYHRAAREATQRLAKDNNDTAAMMLLAEIYRQGLGVKPNLKAAADWYRIAAERGDAHAMQALSVALIEGKGVARNAALSAEWLQKAAARGQPEACYNLALTLLTSGESADLLKAVALLRTASDAELGDAQYALASLYRQGRGVERSDDNAADLMRRAAANGSLAGEVELAIMTFNGEGTGRDEEAAARLFERAATRGNAIAQNRLARILSQGRGLPRNPVEAAGWHLAAKTQGRGDPELDAVFANLTPDEKIRAQRLASDRIEDAALTALTHTGK